jgi:hypothetical protein
MWHSTRLLRHLRRTFLARAKGFKQYLLPRAWIVFLPWLRTPLVGLLVVQVRMQVLTYPTTSWDPYIFPCCFGFVLAIVSSVLPLQVSEDLLACCSFTIPLSQWWTFWRWLLRYWLAMCLAIGLMLGFLIWMISWSHHILFYKLV